ncbi:MAG TPA: hypothetical protein VGW57_15435 [Chthoniobacterales bacterium]|nr:hypothetical protein [Chthoniobacterales bacterium]
MIEANDEPFPPGVSEKELVDTIVSCSSQSPIDSLGPGLNSLLGVADWLRVWCARNKPGLNWPETPAVFIVDAQLHANKDALKGFVAAPMFKTAYSHQIPGHIYVTNRHLRTVLSQTIDFADGVEACRWLANSSFASLPTAIFKPRQRTMMLLEDGAKGEEQIEVPCDADPTAFEATVPDILQSFHTLYTKYPGGYCDVWSKPKERLLRQRVEGMIIKNLIAYIKMAHGRAVNALHEASAPAGRMDIVIFPRSPKSLIKGAGMNVLELKVLRSRRSVHRKQKNGQLLFVVKPVSMPATERWASKGVRQARNYVNTTGADIGHVCCFDGRDVDADLTDAPAVAAQLDIAFHRLFMMNNPPEN